MNHERIARQIARDSKKCCHHGHGMAVFADGSTVFSVSCNDVIARGDGQGGWAYRIAYIDRPLTIADAREFMAITHIPR